MSRVRLLGSLVVGAALLGAALPPQRADAAGSFVQPTASDTLRYVARDGTPFIVGLPARTPSGEASYRLLEAPALSWLVDRSFYWNVQAGEQGTLPILLERLTPGGGRDTLVLLVEIEG